MKFSFFSSQSKNASYMMSERLIRMASSLFFGIWYTNILGPAQYGTLQYAVNIVALLSFLATINLDAILLKELLQQQKTEIELSTNAIALRFTGSTIATLFCLIAAALNQHPDVAILLIIITSSYFLQISDIIDCRFQARNNFLLPSTIRIITTILAAIIKYIILKKTQNIYLIAALSLLDLVVSTILLTSAAKINNIALFNRKYINLSICTHLLKQSAPLCISSALVILFMKIDQLMLINISGSHESGIYSAMLRIIEVWAIFPAMILRAYLPTIVKSAEQSQHFNQLIKHCFRLTYTSALILITIIVIAGNTIISSLYGEKYMEGATVLKILSLSLLFTFSGEVRAAIFLVKNLTIYHAYSALIGIPLLILLNIALIPPLGSAGAAISLVICYAATAMGTTIIFAKLRPYAKIQFLPFLRHA